MSRKGHKLTVERLKSRIVEVQYEDREVLGQRMVTANFKMDNGFIVYGKNPSTAIDPANFDAVLAQEVAYNKTLDQLWELETYRTLSESMLFDVSTGLQINVFAYHTTTSSRYATPHIFSGAYSVDLTFQAPGLDGQPLPLPYRITMVHPTENLSFDEQNGKELDKVRKYLIENMPLERLYPMLIVRIAKVCHEANRAYCEAVLGGTQQPWDDLGNEDRRNICEHVVDILRGVEGRFPTTPASKIFISIVNSFK